MRSSTSPEEAAGITSALCEFTMSGWTPTTPHRLAFVCWGCRRFAAWCSRACMTRREDGSGGSKCHWSFLDISCTQVRYKLVSMVLPVFTSSSKCMTYLGERGSSVEHTSRLPWTCIEFFLNAPRVEVIPGALVGFLSSVGGHCFISNVWVYVQILGSRKFRESPSHNLILFARGHTASVHSNSGATSTSSKSEALTERAILESSSKGSANALRSR